MKNNEPWPSLKEELGTLTLRLNATTVERQGTVHNPCTRNVDANLKHPSIRQTKLKPQGDEGVAVGGPTLAPRRVRVGKAWPARVLLVYSHLDKGVRKEREKMTRWWKKEPHATTKMNPESQPLQTPATILIRKKKCAGAPG